MSVDDTGLLLRSVGCVVGLAWAIRVLARRIVRERKLRAIRHELQALGQPVDWGLMIASRGSLIRASIALLLGLIFVFTSSLLLTDRITLYLSLAPWLGFIFVVGVGAWSVVEEQTDLALERYRGVEQLLQDARDAARRAEGEELT